MNYSNLNAEQSNRVKILFQTRGAFSDIKKADAVILGNYPLDDYLKECKELSKTNHQKYIHNWSHNTNHLNGNKARLWFLKNFDKTIDTAIADIEYLQSLKILSTMPSEKTVKDGMIVLYGANHGDTQIRTKVLFKALNYQQGFQINIGGIDDGNDKPYGIIIPYLTLPKTVDDLIDDLCLLNYPNIISNKFYNTDIVKHQKFFYHANDIDVDLSLKPVTIDYNLILSKQF